MDQMEAAKRLEEIRKAINSAKEDTETEKNIGGNVTMDISAVIAITAKMTYEVIVDFIRTVILNPYHSYTQDDGTIALPKHTVKYLLTLNRNPMEKIPESERMLYVNYAKHIIKGIIEEIIENAGKK